MIEDKDVYSLVHYEYGVAYSGEYGGMRYRIARSPLERVFGKKDKGEAKLEVNIWRGPFCFDKTSEEITTRFFEFTEEGKTEAVAFINGEYEDKKEFWKKGKVSEVLNK